MAKSAKARQVLKSRRALRVFRFQAVDGASGETEMPEKGPEELFALASGPEGVGKNGGVRLSSDAGVFSTSAGTWPSVVQVSGSNVV